LLLIIMLIITNLATWLKIYWYRIGQMSLTLIGTAIPLIILSVIRVTLSPTTRQDNGRSGCVRTHSRAYALTSEIPFAKIICEINRTRVRWIYDLDLQIPIVLGAGKVAMRKSVTNCRWHSRIRWCLKSALASHLRC